MKPVSVLEGLPIMNRNSQTGLIRSGFVFAVCDIYSAQDEALKTADFCYNLE